MPDQQQKENREIGQQPCREHRNRESQNPFLHKKSIPSAIGCRSGATFIYRGASRWWI
jgi:hypothetical protein